MKNLSEEYASALYELAEENSLEDIISEQMKELSAILEDNAEYVKLLDNPSIEKKQRTELALEAFGDAQEYLKNFIMLLVESRRMSEFAGCTAHFLHLYDDKHGIIRAEAVTATALDSIQSEKIKTQLEAKTGKKVILTNTVDSSLIGGVLLKYGTKQIDMSIRTSLSSISEMIANADI
ncbi:MAG: ATP synthase F1 subunit delta [Clostridia bacterium]|nr:ATP synthase F1 subunit delta [Clostridia bacterium]